MSHCEEIWLANPLEQLGVENRSMAEAVLMYAAVVESGEVSVVANDGRLESSFSLCSCLQEAKRPFRQEGAIWLAWRITYQPLFISFVWCFEDKLEM